MPVKSNSITKKQPYPVEIDYPRPEQQVAEGPYAIRVQARIDGPVEIKVDKGPWRKCRQEVGYWWYDWNGQNDGRGNSGPQRKHTVVARAHGGNGAPVLSPVRWFKTELEYSA